MSRLQAAFERGDFVVTCELSPPKGTDLSSMLARAETLRDRVDAFNLTDSAAARMTLDPAVAGHALLQRGLEPIVQVTSRDRNRLAIQGGMLGAAVLGIRNLAVMGGDPPRVGDHPRAKGVYDLFASQIIEAAMALNSGRDIEGNEVRGATQFFVGGVFNPGARDARAELDNTRRKIDAGAGFFQTQAVYETGSYERFLDALATPGLRVLAGVIPIKSAKMADYMNRCVPGIEVPGSMIERIARAERSGDVVEVSLDVAARTIERLKDKCSGVHVMAIGWEKHVPALLERLDL